MLSHRLARRLLPAVATALPLLGGCADPPPPGRPLAGQIAVDPQNPAWLQRYEAGRFFLCGPGDPEGFLYRGTRREDGTRDGDQSALIRKLAGTGANSIYLMAVRSHGGDGDPTQNPFLGNDPARGLNRRVLEQWEQWFSEMDRSGIVIFFFLYDDGARVWDTGHRVGAAERRFIRELVDRFEHHRNLIWVVAEEYSEAYSARRVSRIAEEIRRADDHDHPIAVHKLHGLSFEEFAEDPYLDQFAIQFNVTTVDELHAGVLEAWRAARGRYNLNLSECQPWGGGAEGRKRLWAVALAGAYVMVLGMDIATTPVGDLEDCGRLVRFLESTPFERMEPRDDLAAGDAEYVLARPDVGYILYSSHAPGAVGLKALPAGTYRLRWIDAASGAEAAQEVVVPASAEWTWARPERIGPELALYVAPVPPAPSP